MSPGAAGEFVSRLEDVSAAEELFFEPTPAFGRYRPFLDHAVAHPAKANTNLLEFLVKTFTRVGGLVLDPMAGSGSTCVVAALHGRNAICVDIEPRFCEWMEEAARRVERHQTLGPKGWIKTICGDARRLSGLLLEHADAVITSPPYLKTAERGGGVNRQRPGDVRIGCSTVGRTVDHPDAIDNIGVYGSIDAVITSPPYTNQAADNPNTPRYRRGGSFAEEKLGFQAYSSSGNISNLSGETYLSAMLRVYSEVYKVLKPGGLAIVMVRPFVRNRQVVDLPWHTWLLMEKAGFRLDRVYKLRLGVKSFWRIVYERKNPDVPAINHEYVIVAGKQ